MELQKEDIQKTKKNTRGQLTVTREWELGKPYYIQVRALRAHGKISVPGRWSKPIKVVIKKKHFPELTD